MTTSVLDLVPVDRITAEARQVSPATVARLAGRTLLTLVAAFFFVVGWLAAKAVSVLVRVLGGLWLALVWCGTAVRLGWQEGRRAAVAARAT